MKKMLTKSVLFLGLSIMAQAEVNIHSASYQQQVEVSASGEKVEKWVKATKVVPGSIIRYVNVLNNSGSIKATKLVINNPIPKNMEYVLESASCETTCSLSYSVDGGKTYNKEENLYVGQGEERHLAKASEYTDVRWVLENLSANSKSNVEYQARLK